MPDPSFEVVRIAEIGEPPPEKDSWLIEKLWGLGAVGVIGGAPKSCKTWLALEMAVAVASGRPCLGRFAVPLPGSVLVYAAEDAPWQVRERVENLAAARGTDFASLPLHLIVRPPLRLDVAELVEGLRQTLRKHRPRLLVLDPYVRLQRVEENSATEVAGVLGTLRELSRELDLAIVLVHHARKAFVQDPGQGLRGSSDFRAWGDSNLYLRRKGEDLVLSAEHRSAPAPAPIALGLLSGEGLPVHLQVRELDSEASGPLLSDRVLQTLQSQGPMRREQLRDELHVRNQDLSDALRDLEASGGIRRTGDGWASA